MDHFTSISAINEVQVPGTGRVSILAAVVMAAKRSSLNCGLRGLVGTEGPVFPSSQFCSVALDIPKLTLEHSFSAALTRVP